MNNGMLTVEQVFVWQDLCAANEERRQAEAALKLARRRLRLAKKEQEAVSKRYTAAMVKSPPEVRAAIGERLS